MAVNPCKECGGPVSDKADKCQICGAKVVKSVSTPMVFGIIIITCFFVYTCVNGKSNTSQSKSDTQSQSVSNATTTNVNEQKKNWIYDITKDEMRKTETKFAFTQSLNTVNFDFPYGGGSNLTLSLRKKDNSQDIMLIISKGQFVCGIQKCEAIFKFDDKPLKTITMVGSDTHQSDTLFIAYDKTESEIIKQIKLSKKLVIEVKFYREGSKQFTFDVSNLNW